jgi:hypothetical protein
VVGSVGQSFDQVRAAMTVDQAAPPGLEQAKQINEACAQIVAQMGSK